MITKIVPAMFIALLALLNFPNAHANKQLSVTSLDQTHILYCAESDSGEKKSDYADYEDDEEPDCE